MKAATFTITVFVFLFSPFFTDYRAGASDKENCLMCHKYPFIGRINEQGKAMNYHVNEKMYKSSIHRNVPCRDCHTYIKKIPHDPVKEEVNCANECHIKPPFADEKFSHRKIIEIYNKSVHGFAPDDSPELKKEKPYCKYCHLNPQYERVAEKRISYEETLERCQNCHKKMGVTQAYRHITHRLRKKTTRTPREVVALCRKCHEDRETMEKLKVSPESLRAVETYDHSLHGRSVMLGSKDSADCISCHATNVIHDIYKKDNEKATVNPKNVLTMCGQCHNRIDERFSRIPVHAALTLNDAPFPYLVLLKAGLRLALYGTLVGLMGLFFLETRGRRKEGIHWQLKKGSTWRRSRTIDENRDVEAIEPASPEKKEE